jgi:mannose-6-phosphate isomerase-like protein (cupin superfamily)
MPAQLVVTAAAEGRTPAPLNVVGEATLIKVGPDDCEGRYALFHLVAPPMSGPPLHVHSREDECFYVLDGEIVFEVDGACHTVTAGGCVAVMRGMVHRYQNFTDRNASLLIVTTPGDFAGFFVEISAMTPPGGMPTMEQLVSLDAKYGLTTLGPPMMVAPAA